jgi:sRNA-binding protein
MTKPTIARIGPLIAAWPRAFTAGIPRPLATGIHLDMAADGRFTAEQIGRLLGVYCGRPRYLRALVAGAFRIGLDGKPTALRVTTEEEAHARERLAKADAAKAAKAAKKKAVKPVETKGASPGPGLGGSAPAGSVNPLTGRVILGLRRS